MDWESDLENTFFTWSPKKSIELGVAVLCPTLITLTMMPGSMLVLVWRLQPDWRTLFCPHSLLSPHHHPHHLPVTITSRPAHRGCPRTVLPPLCSRGEHFYLQTLTITNTYSNKHFLTPTVSNKYSLEQTYIIVLLVVCLPNVTTTKGSASILLLCTWLVLAPHQLPHDPRLLSPHNSCSQQQSSPSDTTSKSVINIANSFVPAHFQLLFNGSNQYIDNEVQVKTINSMQRKIVIIVKSKI